MNNINFDNWKCRCSAISKMQAESRSNPCLTEKQALLLAEFEKKDKLTDPQKIEFARLTQLRENSTKVVLSDGCIEYLMESYAWITEQMIPVSKEQMDLLQIRKGRECQKESITMLSILDDEVYTENFDRVENEYLTGEIDAYTGESIYKAKKIVDLKNLWDYPTFLKSIHQSLENNYKMQVQGYGDISKCKDLEVVKALCSNPQEIINDLKFRIAKKFNATTIESPDFLEEWEKWERSMIFDHIPPEKRIFKLKVEPFTTFEQQKVYDRVKVCREWLNNFHETYQNLNKSVSLMQSDAI